MVPDGKSLAARPPMRPSKNSLPEYRACPAAPSSITKRTGFRGFPQAIPLTGVTDCDWRVSARSERPVPPLPHCITIPNYARRGVFNPDHIHNLYDFEEMQDCAASTGASSVGSGPACKQISVKSSAWCSEPVCMSMRAAIASIVS